MDTLLPDIPELNVECLPPDVILDDSHPANDAYLKEVAMLKRRLVAHAQTMWPQHVEMVKRRHRGHSPATIAEDLTCKPETVRRVERTAKGQRLMALLCALSQAIEGPMELHRKSFLWRIAERNELVNPRVSIAAIAEINRMGHNAAMADAAKQQVAETDTAHAPVTINILGVSAQTLDTTDNTLTLEGVPSHGTEFTDP